MNDLNEDSTKWLPTNTVRFCDFSWQMEQTSGAPHKDKVVPPALAQKRLSLVSNKWKCFFAWQCFNLKWWSVLVHLLCFSWFFLWKCWATTLCVNNLVLLAKRHMTSLSNAGGNVFAKWVGKSSWSSHRVHKWANSHCDQCQSQLDKNQCMTTTHEKQVRTN